jgi:nucleoside-diphosphate-sugar epimerase
MRELGWSAGIPLREGIAMTYRGYLEMESRLHHGLAAPAR